MVYISIRGIIMQSIFKKSIELNTKIEKFLSLISNSLLLFEKEIQTYLNGDYDSFESIYKRISKLESEADDLEIDIKTTLYVHLLLPDTRADVLSLIKSLDDLIDSTEEVIKSFYIQRPDFPIVLYDDINKLTHESVKSAETLLQATSAFFNEAHLVSSYINKVNFYEHEADVLEDSINMRIFNDDIVDGLAEKMQLRDFVCKIASLSDLAERIGEKLTIFAIKREI